MFGPCLFFANILIRKRELVCFTLTVSILSMLFDSSSQCRGSVCGVYVIFPDYTHLLFFKFDIIEQDFTITGYRNHF